MDFNRSFIIIKCTLLFVFVINMPACAQNNPFGVSERMMAYFDSYHKFTTAPNHDIVLDSIIRYTRRVKDLKGECLARSLKIEYPFFKNDLAGMRKAQKEIVKFVSATPYKDFMFLSWNRIVLYYINNYNFDKALSELKVYQAEAVRLNNLFGIAQSYRRLGDLYARQTFYQIALIQYDKGEKFTVLHRMVRETPSFYYAKVEVYAELRDVRHTMEYADLLVKSPYTSKIYKMTGYVNLFLAYTQLHDWHKASIAKAKTEDLIKEVSIIGTNRVNYFRALFLYNLGLKNYDKAKKCYHNYLKIEKNKVHLLDSKALWYEGMRQYDSCVYVQREILRVRDSMELNRYNDSQKLLAKSFDFDRLQVETQNLKMQKYRERQKATAAIILSLGVLLFVCLAYALNRRRSLNTVRKEKLFAERARCEAQKMQIKAEQAKNTAESANRLKTDFLHNMSHEIRTPLNAIVGFNDVLNGSDNISLDINERKECLHMIDSNVDLLMTLINDILDISSLEGGSYVIKCENVNVDDLCEITIESVMNKVTNGVSLTFKHPSYIDNVIMYTDRQRLMQVLINYITNAIKYTSKGSIVLTYNVSEENVIFSVTDTGVGIPADKAESIFDRFSKLDKFKQGTGLGLSICKIISKLLHGRVWLDTTYTEKGCRFKFELPIKQK